PAATAAATNAPAAPWASAREPPSALPAAVPSARAVDCQPNASAATEGEGSSTSSATAVMTGLIATPARTSGSQIAAKGGVPISAPMASVNRASSATSVVAGAADHRGGPDGIGPG